MHVVSTMDISMETLDIKHAGKDLREDIYFMMY